MNNENMKKIINIAKKMTYRDWKCAKSHIYMCYEHELDLDKNTHFTNGLSSLVKKLSYVEWRQVSTLIDSLFLSVIDQSTIQNLKDDDIDEQVSICKQFFAQ